MITYETLAGRSIVLEPLDARHTPDLIEAALADQSMFEHMRTVHLHSEQEVRDWINDAMEMARGELDRPYAVVRAADGKAVGVTWYLNIDSRHLLCEIGWTWLAPRITGNSTNLESKLLLLEHALEHCGVHRVSFRVDRFAERSHELLTDLGAVREGVVRADYVALDGSRHDTVLFSILADEWAGMKPQVEQRIGGSITDADRQSALEAVAQHHGVDLPLPRS